MRRGNFLKLLKTLLLFFRRFFLAYVKSLGINNELRNLYLYSFHLNDFNRVIFWRLNSISSIFNVKKIHKMKFVYFLRKERRIVTTLLWLKYIIKMKQSTLNNNNPKLFFPLFNILAANTKYNQMNTIKLRIYKSRLMRGF